MICPHCLAVHSPAPKGLQYGKCVHCEKITMYRSNMEWSIAVNVGSGRGELSSSIQSALDTADQKKKESE